VTYTLEIYLYEDQLIFTGIRDLYFEKYKGIGPGIYSKPILSLSSDCSVSEIEDALAQCISVLEQNEKTILDENTLNTVTQMENILFQNFKSFGIRATKNKVIKNSIMITVRMNKKPFVGKCVPKGRDMVIQTEVPLDLNAQPADVAQYIKGFLD